MESIHIFIRGNCTDHFILIIISAQWFPIVMATLLSIAIVLIVTGWVHQFFDKHKFRFRSKH